MTLPLIYSLNECPPSEKRSIIKLIKHHNRNNEKVNLVIDFVKKYGGLSYAEIKMNEFKKLAISKLESFPENEAKNSLIELVEFSTQRKK